MMYYPHGSNPCESEDEEPDKAPGPGEQLTHRSAFQSEDEQTDKQLSHRSVGSLTVSSKSSHEGSPVNSEDELHATARSAKDQNSTSSLAGSSNSPPRTPSRKMQGKQQSAAQASEVSSQQMSHDTLECIASSWAPSATPLSDTAFQSWVSSATHLSDTAFQSDGEDFQDVSDAPVARSHGESRRNSHGKSHGSSDASNGSPHPRCLGESYDRSLATQQSPVQPRQMQHPRVHFQAPLDSTDMSNQAAVSSSAAKSHGHIRTHFRPVEARSGNPTQDLSHISGFSRHSFLFLLLWVSALCGGSWLHLRSEISKLHGDVRSKLDTLGSDTALQLKACQQNPQEKQWIIASSREELAEVLSKLQRPDSLPDLPETLEHFPRFHLVAGARLLRHSVRTHAHEHPGGSLANTEGEHLIQALAHAQAEDFPVAMLFSVPSDEQSSRAKDTESAIGATSIQEAELQEEIVPARGTRPLASTSDAQQPRTQRSSGWSYNEAHSSLLDDADLKRQPGASYDDHLNPFGDALRIIFSQGESIAALQQVQQLVQAEISRLSLVLVAMDVDVKSTMRIAGQCCRDANPEDREVLRTMLQKRASAKLRHSRWQKNTPSGKRTPASSPASAPASAPSTPADETLASPVVSPAPVVGNDGRSLDSLEKHRKENFVNAERERLKREASDKLGKEKHFDAVEKERERESFEKAALVQLGKAGAAAVVEDRESAEAAWLAWDQLGKVSEELDSEGMAATGIQAFS